MGKWDPGCKNPPSFPLRDWSCSPWSANPWTPTCHWRTSPKSAVCIIYLLHMAHSHLERPGGHVLLQHLQRVQHHVASPACREALSHAATDTTWCPGYIFLQQATVCQAAGSQPVRGGDAGNTGAPRQTVLPLLIFPIYTSDLSLNSGRKEPPPVVL